MEIKTTSEQQTNKNDFFNLHMYSSKHIHLMCFQLRLDTALSFQQQMQSALTAMSAWLDTAEQIVLAPSTGAQSEHDRIHQNEVSVKPATFFFSWFCFICWICCFVLSQRWRENWKFGFCCCFWCIIIILDPLPHAEQNRQSWLVTGDFQAFWWELLSL